MAHKLVVLQGLICCFIHYGGFPGSSENKESTRNTGDLGSTPGFERSPGEGNSYPLQYSCPQNYMDRGTWRAIAHEIAELDTPEWLSIKTLWTAWIQEKQQGSKEKARCCPVPDEVCDVVQVGMLVSEPLTRASHQSYFPTPLHPTLVHLLLFCLICLPSQLLLSPGQPSPGSSTLRTCTVWSRLHESLLQTHPQCPVRILAPAFIPTRVITSPSFV